jgi:hypothetical protein
MREPDEKRSLAALFRVRDLRNRIGILQRFFVLAKESPETLELSINDLAVL